MTRPVRGDETVVIGEASSMRRSQRRHCLSRDGEPREQPKSCQVGIPPEAYSSHSRPDPYPRFAPRMGIQ
ncbi:Adenosylhomocysteinase [Actinacidiphila bryophytorum]|uniref:Adenosylhomocysteinase n=1 Tax=Actinacidiphila bryophytorum TaxID=1436133 RepID=A0A9W4E4L8_9ACTN|nr:Adenosylhomocysteinase [Actinacidiphila bryophytorum]